MKNTNKNIAAAIMLSTLFFAPYFCNAQRVIHYNTDNQTLIELKNELIQIKGEIYTLNHELETLRTQLVDVKVLITILQDICAEVGEDDMFYVADLGKVMTKDELYYFIQGYKDLYDNLLDQKEQLIQSIENLVNRYIYINKKIEAIIKNQ